MTECYARPLALFTLCETSMKSCFASLLRVRTSLEMLVSKYRGCKDFPGLLEVFSDRSFWRKLEEAEQVIAPLSEASYRLQRDENTLADVVISFREIFRGFTEVLSGYRSALVDCVETRWEQCEQPLFLLTFLLNPATTDECRKLIQNTDHDKRVVEVEERLVQGGPTQHTAAEQQRVNDIKEAAKVLLPTQFAKFAAIDDFLVMILDSSEAT
ncbi:hypothetical protein P3T76_001958 [Phytophthora citrophthora]|uniref:Uncharacterized protein n=1 Tax=Phytophthora citrophthora TaxID=4793 RepID=A0AAD9GWQ5_9STRA|nr:hypothetical protein P3T76_001958 [Phytophthora citrophthora]